MGVRILVDGDSGRAVLYCSTRERALPNLFDRVEDAEAFLVWVDRHLARDVRGLTEHDLDDAIATWRRTRDVADDPTLSRWRRYIRHYVARRRAGYQPHECDESARAALDARRRSRHV